MPLIQIDKDLEDIFPDFLQHRLDDIVILTKAIEENDFRKIKTIGHRLAGNAPGYGVTDLGPVGEELEKMAMEENIEAIKNLTKKYQDYLASISIEFIKK